MRRQQIALDQLAGLPSHELLGGNLDLAVATAQQLEEDHPDDAIEVVVPMRWSDVAAGSTYTLTLTLRSTQYEDI